MMSSKLRTILWSLTGLLALFLLLATVGLIIKAQSVEDIGLVVYVTGSRGSAYLRAQPSKESKVVTVLRKGDPVMVKNARTVDDDDWYYVQTDHKAGWLLAENTSLDKP